MPTYDYECNGCGHAFEEFQNISDSLKRKCPECGKLKLRRLIGSGGAVIFKGSGFYQTDYRSSEYKSQASADKPCANSGSCPAAGACGKAADA
jgi:putative FmdB family regulatory protein